MTALRRNPLQLERLDARITPAITVRAQAGNLFVTGYPNDVLTFTQTAANQIKVSDGATNYGPYSVPSGINATLQRFNQGVLFDTGNFTYSGNVNIDLGLGSAFAGLREVSVFDSNGTVGGLGKIAANVSIRNGSGSEYISIGRPSLATGVDLPVQVNGSVFISTRFNAGPDTFELVPGSIVQTNISTTNVDFVTIGFYDPGSPTLATVGGNVVANNPTPAFGFLVETFAKIGGSLTAVSTAGSFAPAALILNDGTTIGTNLTTAFGNGNNILFLGTQIPGLAAPVVGATTNFTSGTGSDSVFAIDDLADNDNMTFFGNVSMSLGAGDNAVNYDPLAFTLGNFTLSASNGNNVVTSALTSSFDGYVGGNLSVTLGNGDNVINFGGTCSGNQIVFQTGGGNDIVNINATAFAPASKLFVYLNGGDDTLNLDSSNFFSGYIDGGWGFGDDFNTSVALPFTWTVTGFEL